MNAVSDSSTLIILSRIDRLEFLKVIFGQVFIPQAVYDDLVVKGKGKPGAKEVDTANWIKVKPNVSW